MKFYITKTSLLWSSLKHSPCEEATKEGHFWIIEFNTIEQLINFSKKYGKLILSEDEFKGSYPCIEIYNENRE